MTRNKKQKTKKPSLLAKNWRRSRGVVAILLIGSSFLLARLLYEHAVNPLAGTMVLEPLFGLLLFWPLSRVLIRATSLLLGLFLSLLPAAVLIVLRIVEPNPNVSFGAVIFFAVVGLTVYFLFRTPPSLRRNKD